ncbi:TPA: stationary-phase-induced ribosome-associated protein [Yersinia enterocolitica]|uniref:stationary-phase-induced ribosome-associated protein n=1 Tax=Yersinia enterocolitica TaxID=630 RepID=UPI0028DE1639|nr:stationary-phase-induced ribosome-associated protein [Yersinia enterocolitica]HEC1638629.1 stationary-phase-induced ribosome-associated protein [Yersinia enterocolitica]
MKSNREAKRLLGMTFNISRRRIVTKSEWTGFHVTVKPSASQNRAKKRAEEVEYAECVCGEWGEVNFDGRRYYCGGSPRCCP